jgi:hypothetical protein
MFYNSIIVNVNNILYEYLFDIKHTDTPFKGSEILWENLIN